ncbi:MAG: hypothetical protein ACPLRR_09860 [Candidatus Saccharicenans sp.]
MKNQALIKSVAVVVLFMALVSLVPSVAAAVDSSSSGDSSTKCFAQFEKCMNSTRIGILKSFIDALDCELELAACIKNALKF